GGGEGGGGGGGGGGRARPPRGLPVRRRGLRQGQRGDPAPEQRVQGVAGAAARDARRAPAAPAGEDVMAASTEVAMRVWRGDARGGAFKEYRVPSQEGVVVLDVIHTLQATQAGGLACRWNA